MGVHSEATNHIASLPGFTPTYDLAGNVTNDSFHQYSWDALGNMRSSDFVDVTYDALDRAVEQQRGASYTQIVYGPDGKKLALMNGTTLAQAFVPIPTGAQAIYTASGLQRYRHADYLGSSRLSTFAASSTDPYADVSYAPFGEPYNQVGTADLSFTGQNEDTVSGQLGLYDFLFREQMPVQGRWLSPDPAGLAVADPANPQSWNRYAYVLNNPLSNIDPLGLDCVVVEEGGKKKLRCSPTQITVTPDPDPPKPDRPEPDRPMTPPGFPTDIYGPNQRLVAWYLSHPLVSEPANNAQIRAYGPPKPSLTNIFTLPGTNYCGPGGKGTPTNGVDRLCMQHDACYEAMGLGWQTNVLNMVGVPMPSKQTAISGCNQNLCQGLSSLVTESPAENAQAFAVGAAFGCIP